MFRSFGLSPGISIPLRRSRPVAFSLRSAAILERVVLERLDVEPARPHPFFDFTLNAGAVAQWKPSRWIALDLRADLFATPTAHRLVIPNASSVRVNTVGARVGMGLEFDPFSKW